MAEAATVAVRDGGRGVTPPAVVADAAAQALALAEAFDHRPRYGGRVSMPQAWATEAARLLMLLAGVAMGAALERPDR